VQPHSVSKIWTAINPLPPKAQVRKNELISHSTLESMDGRLLEQEKLRV